ncbi:aldo/keto reductase [Pseudonocardia ailaonensis]|uniref:Aldo/keto reductase n=1 Tax=Pseudonocardia ailaonensis TaxID=367279 RepID=A0ABN2N2S4_9PSEU
MPRLGSSSIDVFPLALGGNTFGWTSDAAGSEAVLDAYVEAGGNLVDTADSYSAWAPGNSGGESETILGEWMRRRGNRADIVVVTKVAAHPDFPGLSAANVAAAADASLKRLQADHVDLYFAHHDTDPDLPIEEPAAAFDALVRAGKIRTIGLSNLAPERIRAWIAFARAEGLTLPVALQPHYNLVTRGFYERELAPVAEAENLAVLPYFALASGFLVGKYRTAQDLAAGRGRIVKGYLSDSGLAVVDTVLAIAAERGVEAATVALSWLRGRPTVTAPIASARTPAQLPALMASATLDLSAEERDRLDDVSGRVSE